VAVVGRIVKNGQETAQKEKQYITTIHTIIHTTKKSTKTRDTQNRKQKTNIKRILYNISRVIRK
jgi:hypothetical protein